MYIYYIYPSCKRLLIYQLCITLRVLEVVWLLHRVVLEIP